MSLPVNNATLLWEYCDLSRGSLPLKIYTILPKVWKNGSFSGVPVTGCHLCNEPSHKFTLNIPQSAGSGIATEWKQLGMTAIQPQSGRPGKIIAEDQWMLTCIMGSGWELSAESIAADQSSCGLQINSGTVRRELHEMDFHVRAGACKPHITKHNANCGCSCVRHATTGL